MPQMPNRAAPGGHRVYKRHTYTQNRWSATEYGIKHPAGTDRSRNIPFQWNERIAVLSLKIQRLLIISNCTSQKLWLIMHGGKQTDMLNNTYMQMQLPWDPIPLSMVEYLQILMKLRFSWFLHFMGIIYKPRVWIYWSTYSVNNTLISSQVMKSKRFHLFYNFLISRTMKISNITQITLKGVFWSK